ncbi:hypothetical protein IJ541_10255 [bacterium]|nr:hypothetical protein [bacterium]
MTKYLFIENGEINGAGEVQELTNGVLNIEVSDEIYQTYISEPLKYAYIDSKIVENPNYEDLKQQQIINSRIDEINLKLEEYDKKRIRAVCEDEIKDEKTGETWLDYYNEKIYDLRIELKSLKANL